MIGEWLSLLQPYLLLAASVSGVLAVVSLVLVPILIVQMPADYFLAAHRIRRRGFSARWLSLLRNLVALVLLVAGILMLLLPGQGLLTILAAIILSDVPGKYRFERWLVLQPGVLKAINWVRRRYRKPIIVPPPRGIGRKTFGRKRY